MPVIFDFNKYTNPVYIETGLFKGESLSKAINSGFQKLYSIDINPEFINEGLRNFKNYVDENKVEILLGNSIDVLKKLLPTINQKITFYLDAHDLTYQGIDENLYEKKYECPILEEINIISNHEIKEHTIIIDDIKMMIDGGVGWGKGYGISLDLLKNKILSINPKYNFEIVNGINDCLICFF
jgi:hypothetical protein